MNRRQMAIIYGQGQELSFDFPVQATDAEVAHRVEAALKMPSISISTGDALYVIPTSAILSIIVTPPPRRLPPTVIRRAKLIRLEDE